MTGRASAFISDDITFGRSKDHVLECVWPDRQLPEVVFKEPFSHLGWGDLDWALSPSFWPVVQALCAASRDESCLFATLDPDPVRYKQGLGFYNWAIVDATASLDEYWTIMEPGDVSPGDWPRLTSTKMVWLPPSGEWAIWGEQGPELCVLGCREKAPCCEWHDVEWAVESLSGRFRTVEIERSYTSRVRESYSRGL